MMPRSGRTFTAKGGTAFAWYPDGSSDDIEVTLADDRVEWGEDVNKHPFPDRQATWVAKIPRADLDEFIAHIVSQAAEETLGRVLLFPCLQSGPKT